MIFMGEGGRGLPAEQTFVLAFQRSNFFPRKKILCTTFCKLLVRKKFFGTKYRKQTFFANSYAPPINIKWLLPNIPELSVVISVSWVTCTVVMQALLHNPHVIKFCVLPQRQRQGDYLIGIGLKIFSI